MREEQGKGRGLSSRSGRVRPHVGHDGPLSVVRSRLPQLFVATIAALLLILHISTEARASLWSGACLVSVTFNFENNIRLVDGAPDYSVELEALADLDVMRPGMQGCMITLDALEPSRATSGGGSGSSSEWSCAAAVGSGSWEQSWTDGSGSSSPPGFSGSHTITGSWNDWVLTVRNPSLNVVGVAHLSAPFDTQEVDRCVLVGLSEVTMVGVLLFQDP